MMANKAQEKKIYSYPWKKLVEAIRAAEFARTLNLEMKSENPTVEGVWYRFHHSMTMTSWGEKITITLKPLPDGQTEVDILSECGMPTQIVDWGQNKKNIAAIFAYLDKALSATAYTQQAVERKIDPSNGDTPCFCRYCGAQIKERDIYCFNCGKKVKE